MVLEECARADRFRPGQKLVLVGFGVGYSWGATLLEWKKG
jgi:3-oxoacyl-[acyl-carrier-protein] synthase-3